jgi:hypothetical protein
MIWSDLRGGELICSAITGCSKPRIVVSLLGKGRDLSLEETSSRQPTGFGCGADYDALGDVGGTERREPVHLWDRGLKLDRNFETLCECSSEERRGKREAGSLAHRGCVAVV